MRLSRPWWSIAFMFILTALPATIILVPAVGVYPSTGWIVVLAMGCIPLVPSIHFSFGRASIVERTFTYSAPFRSWSFEFRDGDELWGASKPLARPVPFRGALGVYRDSGSPHLSSVTFIRGSAFMSSSSRDLWADVIVEECRRTGLELVYRPDVIEKPDGTVVSARPSRRQL